MCFMVTWKITPIVMRKIIERCFEKKSLRFLHLWKRNMVPWDFYLWSPDCVHHGMPISTYIMLNSREDRQDNERSQTLLPEVHEQLSEFQTLKQRGYAGWWSFQAHLANVSEFRKCIQPENPHLALKMTKH